MPKATAPATPTNLTAMPGNAQVSLSWSAATGATSYSLYRASTNGGEGSTPYRTGLTGTTFTDTGLTNGTPCYYQVTAVNSSGQSGKSSEVSAVPKATAPATPTNLTAMPGNAQVSLSWSARPAPPATASTGPRPAAAREAPRTAPASPARPSPIPA